MRKILILAAFLPFSACKKNDAKPTLTPPPDITENLSGSIINLNPDKYDSARGHVADSFSWSVPHAYGDTGVISYGTYVPPLNATTLILEGLIYAYGTSFARIDQSFLSVNAGSVSNRIGLTIDFPSDTGNLSLGYSIAGFSGGSITFADTVATNRPYGIGLSRMLNWWGNDAIPVNDSVTKYVDINTNPLTLIAQDTLTLTSKKYIGDELVVSGTFSEQLYTALAFTYNGSFCRKTWYIKGAFSNMIWVFKPE